MADRVRRALGQDLEDFYQEWPPGDEYYVEEGLHGSDLLNFRADQYYSLKDLGWIAWQGDPALDEPAGPYQTGDTVAKVYQAWYRDRKMERVVVAVPKDGAARKLLEDFVGQQEGWEVV